MKDTIFSLREQLASAEDRAVEAERERDELRAGTGYLNRRDDERGIALDAAQAQVAALRAMLTRAADAEDPDEWIIDGLALIAETVPTEGKG